MALALDPSPAGGRGKTTIDAAARVGIAASRLEVVAQREGTDLLLYIDDYASNAPVIHAQVDLHQGGRGLRAASTGDGRYQLPADVLDTAVPVTVTVRVTDREWSLPIELPKAASAGDAESQLPPVIRPGIVAIALILVGIVFVLLLRLRRRTDPLPS